MHCALLGVLFLFTGRNRGVSSGPFPYSAGWGRHHHRRVRNSARIEAWARVSKRPPGGCDQALEYFLGHSTSLPPLGSASPRQQEAPLQLIHAGVGSEAMQVLAILPGTYRIGAVFT